jgi:hypothetical protein
MKHGRRSGLVLAGISAISLVTAIAGTALASPASGVKGDPQPELKPFKLGNLAASSAGNIAMEPDGSLVAVYDIASGQGKTLVCLLNRAANSCASKPVLSPLSGDDTFGTPQVFIPSANHVDVLQEACCDNSASGGNVFFTSTDGGRAFGPPVRVGNLDVDAAALVGSQVVFAQASPGSGAQVQSISVTSPAPPASTAIATPKPPTDVAVGSYHNGALVASDYDGPSFYETYVGYAASGSQFGVSSSYKQVGAFGKEQLIGMSGDALLTIQDDGHTSVELRLFNGKGFSPAESVPGTTGGGPEWFAVDQDPSGAVHVFSERGLATPIYDLIENTTTNGGKSWSAPVDLGNAIDDTGFAAALDSHGSGLVLGTSDPLAYPVLASQGVSFKIAPASIRKGKSATASGKGSPAASGRVVTLQVERSGKWFNVATTHEGSGGSFSFKIKGTSAGSFRYRAVAADLAGYLLYGYSNAQSLRVTG